MVKIIFPGIHQLDKRSGKMAIRHLIPAADLGELDIGIQHSSSNLTVHNTIDRADGG